MPAQNIVGIGASSGGVKAISELVSLLPAGFPASLFIVSHVSPSHKSYMPEILNGGPHQLRCLAGHAYSPRNLLEAHSEARERALWKAVMKLEESGALVKQVAGDVPAELAERLLRQAEVKKQQAASLRSVLEQLEPYQLE